MSSITYAHINTLKKMQLLLTNISDVHVYANICIWFNSRLLSFVHIDS